MKHRRFDDVRYVPLPTTNGDAKPKDSKRSARRWHELTLLIEHVGPELSAPELRIAIILFVRSDASTKTVRISHSTLAKVASMSTRQAIRIVNALIEKKLLQVVKRGSNRTHEPNVYRYLWASG